jgi:hypothetical protein
VADESLKTPTKLALCELQRQEKRFSKAVETCLKSLENIKTLKEKVETSVLLVRLSWMQNPRGTNQPLKDGLVAAIIFCYDPLLKVKHVTNKEKTRALKRRRFLLL